MGSEERDGKTGHIMTFFGQSEAFAHGNHWWTAREQNPTQRCCKTLRSELEYQALAQTALLCEHDCSATSSDCTSFAQSCSG